MKGETKKSKKPRKRSRATADLLQGLAELQGYVDRGRSIHDIKRRHPHTTKKRISEYGRFMALSDAEKDAEVASLETRFDPKAWRPLTPAQRKQWARIKRRLG